MLVTQGGYRCAVQRHLIKLKSKLCMHDLACRHEQSCEFGRSANCNVKSNANDVYGSKYCKCQEWMLFHDSLMSCLCFFCLFTQGLLQGDVTIVADNQIQS